MQGSTPSDLGGLEEEIIKSIRRIVRAIELHSRDLIAEVGLTAPQLSVLKAIKAKAPATPTNIARELSLSQPTVSGILDRLAAKNLVERAETPGDKRLHSYQLTEASQHLLSRSPTLLHESFRKKLRKLQDWERSLLLASLQRVASMMDADQLEAGHVLTAGAQPGATDLEV
jgi:DNA-binding MarR family transcriptional regulator